MISFMQRARYVRSQEENEAKDAAIDQLELKMIYCDKETPRMSK